MPWGLLERPSRARADHSVAEIDASSQPISATRRIAAIIASVMPGPGGPEHFIDRRQRGNPAQQLARPTYLGDKHRRVAGAARRLSLGYTPANEPFGGRDHLADRMAGAC